MKRIINSIRNEGFVVELDRGVDSIECYTIRVMCADVSAADYVSPLEITGETDPVDVSSMEITGE